MKKLILSSLILLTGTLATLNPSTAFGTDALVIGRTNPHFLSTGEWDKWRVLCAKIDNEINALHRRINVLTDMKNRHGKPEELQAMASSIRSSIDEVFNEVNTEMCDRKLFVEDSRAFMGKLVSVKRSLEDLGKF